MKKNNRSMLMLFGLMLMMCCAVFVSGTYAKYTSKYTGKDEATIAKWAWEVNTTAINGVDAPTTYTLDLFTTINDTVDGADETDVADDRIAPGTKGSFEIEITNNSEVNGKYAVDFTETIPTGANIVFSTTESGTYGALADIVADDTATRINQGETKTLTYYWKWDYSKDDATDKAETLLALNATAQKLSIQADVTLTQID